MGAAVDGIEWEEPPPMEGTHQSFFDELRRHPGEWAVWRRKVAHPGGDMDRLKRGMFKGLEQGEIEVRSHRTQGKTTIYVRIPKGTV